MLHIPHSLKYAYFEKEDKHKNKDKTLRVNLNEVVDFLNAKLTSCMCGVSTLKTH